jgi:hypothetical protein
VKVLEVGRAWAGRDLQKGGMGGKSSDKFTIKRWHATGINGLRFATSVLHEKNYIENRLETSCRFMRKFISPS